MQTLATALILIVLTIFAVGAVVITIFERPDRGFPASRGK